MGTNLIEKYGAVEPEREVNGRNLLKDYGEQTIINGQLGTLMGTEFIPDKDSPNMQGLTLEQVVDIPSVGPFPITIDGVDVRPTTPDFKPTLSQDVALGALKGPTELASGLLLQLPVSALESVGLAREGSTKAISKGTKAVTDFFEEWTGGDPYSGAAAASSMVAQSLPLARRIPISAKGGAKPLGIRQGMKEGSATGLVLGAGTYIEGQEEPVFGERLYRGAVASGTGGIVPLFFGLGGMGYQAATGSGARREAIRGMNAEDVAAADYLQSKGYTVTPGGAMDSVAKLYDEGRLTIDDFDLKHLAEKRVQRNKALAGQEVDKVINTLLPEGDQTAPILSKLYTTAFDAPIARLESKQLDIINKQNGLLEKINKQIERDPLLSPTFNAFKNGSIGRLNMQKQMLDDKVSDLMKLKRAGTIKSRQKIELANANQLRATLRDIGVKNSAEYGQALELAARKRVVNNIRAKIGGVELKDLSPEELANIDRDFSSISAFDFYNKVLKNQKAVNDIFSDVGALKNKEIGDDTIKKVIAVRDLLRKIEPSITSLDKLSKTSSSIMPERSGLIQQSIIWAKRLTTGDHNNKILEFILDERWASKAIDDISKLPPKEAAVAFGVLTSRASSLGYMGMDHGQAKEIAREPTKEEKQEREIELISDGLQAL